ncbi:MAG: tRNA (N6-isopentenyl adenosine(37)-C2)-methylthiotransferase MiaB [Planctomycetota bacterium]
MSGKTVHVKSFGCQMNKLDTALVNSALKESGFDLTDRIKEADVVLINTCSVREHAEQRVISHLGHLQHIKESRPDIVVGVIGCMAQRLGPKLLEHEAVDIVCGPAQIPQVIKLITKTIKEKKETVAITEIIRQKTDESQALALESFESAYGADDKYIPGQAYVRTMRGCDNFCTYCIVPYVRGPEVSRPPKAIINQIAKLADTGVKQVTLLGQRVNSYKYQAGDKTYCLADLLRMASDIEGIEWIRFVTSYPSQEFFYEILQAMADLPKVCNYLHIPAQSGSDKILRAMNRHYTTENYLTLLTKARDVVPDIAIASDFIVGFPGETDVDFEATVDLVKKARYKNCFIFKYSPRPDTTADKRLDDDIPLEVKKNRNIKLLAVQEKISEELSAEYLYKEVKVLVEGLSKKSHLNSAQIDGNPQLIGRTATDYIVVFNGPESLAGQFAKVKITKTSPLTLFGRLE